MKSRKNIVKELDRVFSLYVRHSHAKDGMVECCTCGRSYPVKKIQNGHFMSRKNYITRWDEENCAPQCYGCNVMKQGEQYLFAKYLDQKYGDGHSDKMLIKSKKTIKYSNDELLEMIDKYKNRLSTLCMSLISLMFAL